MLFRSVIQEAPNKFLSTKLRRQKFVEPSPIPTLHSTNPTVLIDCLPFFFLSLILPRGLHFICSHNLNAPRLSRASKVLCSYKLRITLQLHLPQAPGTCTKI